MKQLILVTLFLSASAYSKVHEIKMLNKDASGQTMVFEPMYLKVEKGDSVKFIPTDKSHSVQSFDGGTPAGAKPWKAGLNNEIIVKFDVEGVHFVKCLPHFPMGMIAAIQVGAASNKAQVSALKITSKFGKERYAKILSQIK